jgi:hypothetical protein
LRGTDNHKTELGLAESCHANTRLPKPHASRPAIRRPGRG